MEDGVPHEDRQCVALSKRKRPWPMDAIAYKVVVMSTADTKHWSLAVSSSSSSWFDVEKNACCRLQFAFAADNLTT